MNHLDRKPDLSSIVSSLTATFAASLFLASVAGCGTDEPGAGPASTDASVAASTPVSATVSPSRPHRDDGFSVGNHRSTDDVH